MDMTGNNGIFVVPAEHVPGLIALLATPLVLWVGVCSIRWFAKKGSAGALRLSGRLSALSFPAKAAVVAMVIGATVHAAIVPTHWGDARVLAVLFILDSLGFIGAVVWTLTSRPHWQLVSAAMLGGTVAGYAFYLAKGWESADPVGMAVSLIELSGCFLVLLAGHTAFADPVRRNRLVLSSLGASTALLIGTVAATGTAAATSSLATASPVHGTSAMGAMRSGSDAGQSVSRSSMRGMDPTSGPSSSSTTMPTMSSTAPGTSASTNMPGAGTSISSGGMQAMPSGGSTGASTLPMPTMPSGDSGNTGTGMPGMGGGGGSNSPLSLSTTSPAGNITWPLAMGTMGAGMQMVTPTCTTAPTTAQQTAAVSLVDQSVSALAPFESLAAAKAAGYIPITPSGAPVVHYANPAYLATPQTLDPGAIEALVYANTSHGAILVAAMYAMENNQLGQAPPMPGGCLTEWHIHTNLCFSNASGVVVGVVHGGGCAVGSTNHVTQPMIHVWLAPLSGGPLVVDAPDGQVVAAASQLPVPNPPNPTA